MRMPRAEFAASWDMSNVYKILVGKTGYKALFGHTSSRRRGYFNPYPAKVENMVRS